MFQSLSDRLTSIFQKLSKRGALTEEDVILSLREIRVALLEADVSLSVVKTFMDGVKEKAIGKEVIQSITPGQLVIKIVHDQLVDVLGQGTSSLSYDGRQAAVFMMVGLQGSGKTTSAGKLAKYLKEKEGKKVLLASVDIYRPAAQEQLNLLGQQCDVDTLSIIEGEKPLEIIVRAKEKALSGGYDVLIIDTAGRLQIDHVLMDELKSIKSFLEPKEVLLVADCMTGQESVHVAEAFNNAVGVTGIILTRVDGDSRGGAALSMKSVTGCPIKFMGTGEQLDQWDVFHPERIASRLLDQGDVVSLVEKAMSSMDQQAAESLAQRMSQGHFDLNDMFAQLQQVLKMGGIKGIMSFLPGMGQFQEKMDQANPEGDQMIRRQLAMIQSMTPRERRDPKIINGSRRRRIAQGAGVQVYALNRLLKQFQQMETTMKQMKKLGQKGLMRGGLNRLFGRR